MAPWTVPPDASETVRRIEPQSTCARIGAALHKHTTRLVTNHREIRPNKVERALPFIAFLPGPCGPIHDKSGQRAPMAAKTAMALLDPITFCGGRLTATPTTVSP